MSENRYATGSGARTGVRGGFGLYHSSGRVQTSAARSVDAFGRVSAALGTSRRDWHRRGFLEGELSLRRYAVVSVQWQPVTIPSSVNRNKYEKTIQTEDDLGEIQGTRTGQSCPTQG